jgi:hypothetical protein
MAIVVGSHVTIYSHVQCHMAIFPPCLVFADFQFAAFTVFFIANLLYVFYSAAFHIIITCIVSRFPRYFGASLGASVPVFYRKVFNHFHNIRQTFSRIII